MNRKISAQSSNNLLKTITVTSITHIKLFWKKLILKTIQIQIYMKWRDQRVQKIMKKN